MLAVAHAVTFGVLAVYCAWLVRENRRLRVTSDTPPHRADHGGDHYDEAAVPVDRPEWESGEAGAETERY